jgi:diacylglycerol kinase (ATP)
MMDHIKRLYTATVVSLNGMRTAWRSDITVRQWAIVGIIAAIAGLFVGETGVERAILVGFSLQILLVELLNTAIEAAIDRIGPERNRLSKAAKDIGSMAVFLAFLIALAVWILILLG